MAKCTLRLYGLDTALMSTHAGLAGPDPAARPTAHPRPAQLRLVTLRPMTRADFPSLAASLRAPHVEAWFPWAHGDTEAVEAVEAEYGPCVDGVDPTELLVIEVDAQPAGFMQRYRISDNPDWAAALAVVNGPGGEAALDASVGSEAPAGRGAVRLEAAVGIDYAIGVAAVTGRGVGSEAIRQLVADTFSRFAGITALWWRCSRRTGRRGVRSNARASSVAGRGCSTRRIEATRGRRTST